MDELLFPLTDDVSWECSPFFHSELKINTVMNCINFFLPVSLVSLCKESLTGQFVPQEMERKEQCTRTLLTYSLLMAFTIANLNHRESRKYLYS